MDGDEGEESACPICFETFEESGDHVARLLPCGGITCEKCISELIADDAIECPECGSEHAAQNGVSSFPTKTSSQEIISEQPSDGQASQAEQPVLPETTGSNSTPVLPPLAPEPRIEDPVTDPQQPVIVQSANVPNVSAQDVSDPATAELDFQQPVLEDSALQPTLLEMAMFPQVNAPEPDVSDAKLPQTDVQPVLQPVVAPEPFQTAAPLATPEPVAPQPTVPLTTLEFVAPEPVAPEPTLQPAVSPSTSQEGEEETASEEKCKIHGIHPFIFCQEPYCLKAIQLLQSQEDDIVDAEDELFDTLFSDLESATKLLTTLKFKISRANQEIDEKNRTCLQRLKSKQEELVKALPNQAEIMELVRKRFEEMTKGASDLMGRLNKNIKDEVTAIGEHLNMLDSIKETTHTSTITRTELTKELETIKNIEAQVRSNISDTLSLRFLEYDERPGAADNLARLCSQLKQKDSCEKLSIAEDVESLCGYLRQRETCVHLAQADDDDLIVVDVQVAKKSAEERPRQDAGDIPTVGTKYQQISYLSSLHDGTVVVCGKKHGRWKLTRFNIELNGEVCGATLGLLPSGMSDITLNGAQCIALSYMEVKEIVFHDVNNLEHVIVRHSVARYEPMALCTASPTILMYCDASRSVRDVRWLDCSGSVPRIAHDIRTTATQQNSVSDMCCMHDGQLNLVVTSRGYEGISTYSNRGTGRLEWNMKGELLGMDSKMCAGSVTTDGRGHFFVCDSSNKCIQIFSPGGYKGAIWNGAEKKLGLPVKIRWCKSSSSLNVVYVKGNEHKISKIQVNMETVLRGDQIKREAPEVEEEEDSAREPPSKKSRWDSTMREQTTSTAHESAAGFKCEVTHELRAKFSSILHVHPLSDSTIIVCGKEDSKWKLVRFCMEKKKETGSTTLKYKPDGLALITLVFQQCLAISYSSKERIDFHHVDRLKEVVCSYRDPHQPGHMCAASPSVLLYEDRSVTPRVVRWLNCSASPPKPVNGRNITRTNHAIIWDMCSVTHSDKQLIVMTRANNGIFAYNTKKAKTGWSVKGKLTGMEMDMSVWGITSDECGHVFACDINNSCVQMFSARGRYMGILLKEGNQGMAQPWLIRWCKPTSSLVVVHIKERKYQISVIKVTGGQTVDDGPGDVILAGIPAPIVETPTQENTPAVAGMPPRESTPAVGTTVIPQAPVQQVVPSIVSMQSAPSSQPVTVVATFAPAQSAPPSLPSSRPVTVRTEATVIPVPRPKPTEAPQPSPSIKLKGVLDINTKCTSVWYMCTISASSMVLCGEQHNNKKIIHLNMKNGAVLDSAYIHQVPSGMEEVKMTGKLCIAVSYASAKLIEFHDASNLKEVVLRYPSAFPPMHMCLSLSSPSTLLIVDNAVEPRLVKYLYCSTSPMPGSNKIKTQQAHLYDMCTVQHGNKRLLVTTGGFAYGLNAYNTTNNKLEWHVKGKQKGMKKNFAAAALATDSHHHLYVVDYANHCIQMFKIDGTYLGAVLQFEDASQCGTWRISWCNKASSLILGRTKNDHYHVNVFRVASEGSEGHSAIENMECAPEYSWKVSRTRHTARTNVAFMCLVVDTVVLCGKEDKEWKLSQYDLKKGVELSGTVLSDLPWGMTEVSLGGRTCLAMSYMSKKQIDFHYAETLSTVVKTFYTVPHLPSRLCAKSCGSILLYEDVAKIPHLVRWLDCRTPFPKPVEGVNITHTQLNFIQDMCFVAAGDKELLIITKGFGGGVYAYNTAEDKLVWSVEGKLPGMDKTTRPIGVTTNGAGHLFVTDNQNMCIHMFSIEGDYMGALLRDDPQQIVQLAGIRWSSRFSSLAAVHMVNSKFSISAIQDTLKSVETVFEDQIEEVMPEAQTMEMEETAQSEATSQDEVAPQQEEEPMEEDVILVDDTPTPTKEKSVGEQETYNVFSALSTTYPQVLFLTALPDGRLAVCYKDTNNTYRLIRVNKRSEVQLAVLNTEPSGMALITLNGKLCLAVSFAQKSKIKFYNVIDESAAPEGYVQYGHKPGRLCAASASILLYVNHAANPCNVHWVYCGGPTPKPVIGTNVTHTRELEIVDVCCVQSAQKLLVIIAGGYKGVLAYNKNTDSLEWNLKGKPPGMRTVISAQRITANESGHLFVSDHYNDCIQMFTLTGEYMGAVTKETDTIITKPWSIQWCKSTSSLIVAHKITGRHKISRIQVNTDVVESQLADAILNKSSDTPFKPTIATQPEPQQVAHAEPEPGPPGVTPLLPPPPPPAPLLSIAVTAPQPVVPVAPVAPAVTQIEAPPVYYNRETPAYQRQAAGGSDSTGQDIPSLNYTVVPLTRTGHRNVSFVAPLGGTDIIVCGMEGGHCSLNKYNLHTGRIIEGTSLNRKPDGLATVSLNGRQCLALSYTNKKLILFYDINNNTEVLHVYSTAPNKPGRLCNASPNILLYEDRSMFPCAIKWLDCRWDLPQPAAGANITHTQQGSADDLCYVQDGKQALLIVTRSLDGIYAYSVEEDKLAWKVESFVGGFQKIALESVVTDGRGLIFVGDQANSCIQVFSSNGMHLGVVFKDKTMVLSQTPRITWCNSVSSILVVHMVGQQYFISKVQDISVPGAAPQPQLVEESDTSDAEEHAQNTIQGPRIEDDERNLVSHREHTQPAQSSTSAIQEPQNKAEVLPNRDPDMRNQIVDTVSPLKDTTNMDNRIFNRENIHAPQLSVNVKTCVVSFICALPSSLVVCGKVNRQWKLIQCWMRENVELSSALGDEPTGMTAITLSVTRRCVAVSFKASMQIVFYDADDVSRVVRRHATDPGQPGRLCTSSSTILLYEDQSQKPRQLMWLDCTRSYPTAPTTGINITYTRHASLVDICCVRKQNQQLVVTARGFHGIDAYNMRSSKLEWSVIGKLPGMTKGICAWSVTTDGAGQIYIGDKGNTCVQVVASDGLHLRTIRRPELGQLFAVRWMDTASRIVCTHKKDDKFYISEIDENAQVETEAQTETVSPVIDIVQQQQQQQQIEQQPQQQQQQIEQQQQQQQQSEQQQQQQQSEQQQQNKQQQPSDEVESSQEIRVTEDMDISDGEEIIDVETPVETPLLPYVVEQTTEPIMQMPDFEAQWSQSEAGHGSIPQTTKAQWPQPEATEFAAQGLIPQTTEAQWPQPEVTDFAGQGLIPQTTEGQWYQTDTQEEEVIQTLEQYEISSVAQLEHSHISFMSLLDEQTIVLCGIEFGGHCKLSKYRTQDFSKLDSAKLKETPWGMAVVRLGGQLCVALSYSDKQKIEFHDADKLTSVVLSHSLPRQPGRLSASSSTLLQYEDRVTAPREVKWLDCSANPPTPAEGTSCTHTTQKNIHDMCCVQYEGKELMVVTEFNERVHAYDTSTDKLEWSLKGKLQGMRQEISAEAVATDNHGNLFVCDGNNACIQVCSMEGAHLGTIFREDVQSLTKPWKICWSNNSASLIVAHMKDKQYCVSLVRNTTKAQTIEESPVSQIGTTKHKEPSQMVAFTIMPVAEAPEPLPVEVVPSAPEVAPAVTEITPEPISIVPEVEPVIVLDSQSTEMATSDEIILGAPSQLPVTDQPAVVLEPDVIVLEESVTDEATHDAQTESTDQPTAPSPVPSEPGELDLVPFLDDEDLEPCASGGMDISYDEVSDSDLPTPASDSESDTTVDDAIQLDNYKVATTNRSEHSSIFFFTTLSDNSIVMCGKEDKDKGSWRLTKYRMSDFTRVSCTFVEMCPRGIAEITLGSKRCLAISYKVHKKIVFRDIEKVGKIIHTHNVRFEPVHLCAASPTVLLYEDRTRARCEVRWLDCSSSNPKPVTGKNVTFTKQDVIWDMCCVEHEGKKLLVTTHGSLGIIAYNLATDAKEWRVKGRKGGKKDENKNIGVYSITTDGRGHLFVCGHLNPCIWMFSAAGTYLATIMRQKNFSTNQRWYISWSLDMAALVVAHTKAKDSNFHVTTIKEISEDKEKENRELEEAETTLDVDKFLDDLTQKDPVVSSTPAKERGNPSDELEVSVTDVEDLEKIRENLLKELAEVPEEEVTSTENSQNSVEDNVAVATTDDSQNTTDDVVVVTDDSQNTENEAVDVSMEDDDIPADIGSVTVDDAIQGYVSSLAAKLRVVAATGSATSVDGKGKASEEKSETTQDATDNSTATSSTTKVPDDGSKVDTPEDKTVEVKPAAATAEKPTPETTAVNVTDTPAETTPVTESAQLVTESPATEDHRDTEEPEQDTTNALTKEEQTGNDEPMETSVDNVDESAVDNGSGETDIKETSAATASDSRPTSTNNEQAHKAVEMTSPETKAADMTSESEKTASLTCKAVNMISTEYKLVAYMCALPDDSVIVCGKRGKQWRLTQYSLADGSEMSGVKLTKRPDGLALVALDGKPCVALSYMNTIKIEFRDIQNLNEVVNTYLARQCRPMRICAMSTDSLLFIDHKAHPHEGKWLDCRSAPPEPKTDATVTHIQQDIVGDLCFAQNGHQNLLVITGGLDGVSALNTETDKIEWTIKGNLEGLDEQLMVEGVTTDGRGHLFISDESNGCIHTLSVSGAHEGVLLKAGDHGLGKPKLIHYCSEASSLIVGHIIAEQYCISKIQITEETEPLPTAQVDSDQKKPDVDPSGKDDKKDDEDESGKSPRKGKKGGKKKGKGGKKPQGDQGEGIAENTEPLRRVTRMSRAVQSQENVQPKETNNQSLTEEDVDMFLDALTQNIPEPANKSASAKRHINTEADIERTVLEQEQEQEGAEDENMHQTQDIRAELTLKNKPAELPASTFVRKLTEDPTLVQEDDVILVDANAEKGSSHGKRKALSGESRKSPVKKRRIVRTNSENACSFPYQVAKSTVKTEHCQISYMAVLTENSIVVSSKDHDIAPWRLTLYDTEKGRRVERVTLSHIPDGLASVRLDGKHCVAVSYVDKMQIDFHDVSNLSKVVHSQLVSSNKPGRLCTASTCILLYEDQSKDPRELRWLNCSSAVPKLANPAMSTSSTHTQQDIIWDVCCVNYNSAKLVITTKGYQGIYAYNANEDKLLWHVKGKLDGMAQDICAEALTTDRNGHLFVCDRDNECVQIITVDGTYLGPLFKEKRQSLEQPLKLRWNTWKSSLVMAHVKNGHYAVSMIPIQQSDLDSLKRIEDDETSADSSFEVSEELTTLKFTVTSTLSTEHDKISFLSPVSGNSVAICGVQNGQWKLKLYNQHYNGALCSVKLPHQPDGMTVVTLDGKPCLALSYTGSMKIFFHNTTNLNEIVLSYSVAPHSPGPMYTASPTTLLYEDVSKYPLVVRWLDCSWTPPQSARGVCVTHTQQVQVWDMCFVRSGDKKLLITTRGHCGGIYGYNTKTDKLDWIVKGKLPGMEQNLCAEAITTDNQGYLFVCDTKNACIQMFSGDGTYLGCALKAGEQGIGGPLRIRWCNGISSLSVVHIKDLHYQMSMVKVTSDEAKLDRESQAQTTAPEAECSQIKECAVSQMVSDSDWTIETTLGARHKHISYVTCLADSTIVVCCNEDHQWKLIQYDLVNDKEVGRAILDNQPDGMTDVTLGGIPCLALSYLHSRDIDFYDVNNMHETLVSFPVAPHLPGRLCAFSGTTLLYEDESKHPHVIRWLDCAVSPPKPLTQKSATSVKVQTGICDMFCAQFEDKKFLLLAHGHKGISAYNAQTNKLEWSVEGKVTGADAISPQGLTTDGRGHLFICDKHNKCIQMFSLDGAYMGTVLGHGKQAVRKPWRIRWCAKTSSLIVVYKKEKFYRISVLKYDIE